MNRVAVALLVCPISANAAPSGPVGARVDGQWSMPQSDPEQGDGGVPTFYSWTDPIPKVPAGTLLRSQPLQADLGLVNASDAIRILYTSVDAMDGRPIVVSGALFIPKGEPPEGGWPLVAWAHGSTGMADICAPSVNPRSERDARYLNTWLAAGFAIVSSDYQGLGTAGPHPYTNFKANAFAVLDSIRSVQRNKFPISNRALLLGQSQGAGTVVATAGYAPDYAPELDIVGTVATGVPNLIREAMVSGVPAKSSSTDAYVMMSVELTQANPAVKLEQLLKPAGMPLAKLVNNACLTQIYIKVRDTNLKTQDVLQPSTLQQIFSYNLEARAYPTTHLQHPLFVGIGGADTNTPAEGAKALVKKFCAAGTQVQAHFYPGQDHSGAVNTSAPDGIAFAKKVWAGEPIAPICDP